MDIYYFYNGINNIINLALKDKKYMDNYELIFNDPLVILDFNDSKKLKGGAGAGAVAVGKELLKDKQVQEELKKAGKNTLEKTKKSSNGKKDNGESKNNKKTSDKNSESNSTTNVSNNNNDLSPKEKALKIIKILFTIVYYLCLFSILPLLPFLAISYYSFKRLKIFYNTQMGTL